MQAMLPYFAASGHFLYTKSAYCYLQQMQELQDKNQEVYRSFVNGYNVVRRSDTFFCGDRYWFDDRTGIDAVG